MNKILRLASTLGISLALGAVGCTSGTNSGGSGGAGGTAGSGASGGSGGSGAATGGGGTGGGTGGGGTISGLPAGKKLGDVTDAEAKAACEKSNAYFNQQISPDKAAEVNCIITFAFTGTSTKADCESQLAGCVAEAKAEPPEDNCKDAVNDATDCQLTIGEIEACSIKLIEAVKTAYDQIDCSAVEDPMSLQSLGPDTSMIPECQKVEMACPNALGGTEE